MPLASAVSWTTLRVPQPSVLQSNPLFAVALLLLVGLLLGLLAQKIGLPEITGYIVAGLLVGPSVFNWITEPMADDLQLLTELALAVIAFTIGGALRGKTLRRLGKAITGITGTSVLTLMAGITLVLGLAGMAVPVALILGIVACATSPGTTVAVVQALDAHGPFVDHLFGVVAIQNAAAITLFGVAASFAPALLDPATVAVDHTAVLLSSLGEIAIAVLFGACAGYVLRLGIGKHRREKSLRLSLVITLLITTGGALAFGLSPLLVNTVAGAVVVNAIPGAQKVFNSLRALTPPLYAVFFVLAGAKFDATTVFANGLFGLGTLYLVVRFVCLNVGPRTGAALVGAPPPVRRYLGPCLLPQAGVALGLTLLLQAGPAFAALPPPARSAVDTAVGIVLLAVFIQEILGPPVTQFAVRRGIAATQREPASPHPSS